MTVNLVGKKRSFSVGQFVVGLHLQPYRIAVVHLILGQGVWVRFLMRLIIMKGRGSRRPVTGLATLCHGYNIIAQCNFIIILLKALFMLQRKNIRSKGYY